MERCSTAARQWGGVLFVTVRGSKQVFRNRLQAMATRIVSYCLPPSSSVAPTRTHGLHASSKQQVQLVLDGLLDQKWTRDPQVAAP